jgi:hypothetical protein
MTHARFGEPIDLKPYEDRLRIYSCEDCQDPGLNRLFAEEIRKAGLEDRTIQLLTPVDAASNRAFMWTLPWASGNKEEGYAVQLTGPFGLLPSQVRDTIRHELGHIKLGHCDTVGKLPPIIKQAYLVWAEIQAQCYAWFG